MGGRAFRSPEGTYGSIPVIPSTSSRTIAAMGRQQGIYTNVAASGGGNDDDDVVVPVATAVAAGSSSLHGGSSVHSGGGLPTASKIDVKDGSKKGTNPHDVADDNDGVTITWEKGEVQPTAFRDVAFAIIFLVHLVAVIGAAFVFGPAALNNAAKQDDGNDERGMDDDISNNNDPSSSSSEAAAPPAEFWIFIVLIAVIAAPILSITALGFMSRNAQSLIHFSLWFSVVLCSIAAVTFLIVAPPAGIIYGIFAALLICYARSVQHKIPYAACNLKCGIDAVTSNLGVSLVALGSMIVLVLFSTVWALGFVGTMTLDQMKAVPVDGGSGSNSYNGGVDDQTDLSPLGSAVVCCFLLSFYWTHQVLKNIVRASVAGVVGTWWFSPLEASSFCSMAVRDSFVRSSTYSLGSICFGSLIVALLQLLRSILRSAANDRNNNSNGILRCIAYCILTYIERIVEYFNKWAYVYVGLYGYDYLTAGKRVMGLFKTRGWSAIIADNLVNRLLGIISLTIGLLVGLCSLFVAFLVEEFESKGGWLGAGFVVGFIIGLILSGVVMGLLSSAVDSIIVCYAEAPTEFEESHPHHSQEMQETWAAAWPDLGLRGPVIISLGGGMGLV